MLCEPIEPKVSQYVGTIDDDDNGRLFVFGVDVRTVLSWTDMACAVRSAYVRTYVYAQLPTFCQMLLIILILLQRTLSGLDTEKVGSDQKL